jgi:hypothetical protein
MARSVDRDPERMFRCGLAAGLRAVFLLVGCHDDRRGKLGNGRYRTFTASPTSTMMTATISRPAHSSRPAITGP